MKKKKTLLLLIILIIAFIAVTAYGLIYYLDSGLNLGDQIPAEPDVLYYCEQDRDCITVPKGPCGCSMSGTDTSINKKYLEYWELKLMKEYQGIVCGAAIACQSEAVCNNNKCEAIIKRLIRVT